MPAKQSSRSTQTSSEDSAVIMVPNRNAKTRAEALEGLIPPYSQTYYEYKDPNFENSRGLPKKFFLLFMKLPKELRDRIYVYVAAAPATKTNHLSPEAHEDHDKPQNWISVARRPNLVQLSPGIILGEFRKNGARWLRCRPLISERHKVEIVFFRRKGLLDFFEKFEYTNIEELVYALTKIRGPDIGILDDFLNWFWRNVTLEFKAERNDEGFFECFDPDSVPLPKYLSNVRHISFKFEPTRRRHTRSLRRPLENRQEDPEFRKLCTFVAETMPNLQTVLLWITLRVRDLELILAGHSGQGWAAAFRSILVTNRFEVHLRLKHILVQLEQPCREGSVPGDCIRYELDAKSRAELLRQREQDLTRLLMPSSLRGTSSA